MTDYYFYPDDDPSNEFGYLPVPLDDVVAAMQRIAKKEGIRITDADIVHELRLKKKQAGTGRTSGKRRISLYIDGTNLFAGQNQLFGPKRFLPFATILADIRKLFPVHKIFFYATYLGVQRKHSSFRFLPATEAQFYHQVKATPRLTFFKGHRSPTSGKEKGVDVHLAVDMVRHAFRREYDEAILVTGDADLIYPLEVVQALGLPVHAVFFPNRFSLEIAFKARSATVINYNGYFQRADTKSLPEKLRVIGIKRPRL